MPTLNTFERVNEIDLAYRDDTSLVDAAQNGDRTAFEILVQRHERIIRFKVQRITGNHEDTEDVLQQTFHNALVHLRNFEGRSSFSTWLMRIAINEALMLKRNSWRSRGVSIDDSDAESAAPLQIADTRLNPERSYARQERNRILYLAMDQLRPGMRDALQSFDLNEESAKETARLLGVSVSAVKSRVNRARRLLRGKLERQVVRGGVAARDALIAA